jgi:hypothetical protein
LDDAQLAARLSNFFGVSDRGSIEDFQLSYTEHIDENHHIVMRAQSFKRFNVGIVEPTQARLHPDEAVERGIELVVDYNSRRGYNLGTLGEETNESVNALVAGAFDRVGKLADDIAGEAS